MFPPAPTLLLFSLNGVASPGCIARAAAEHPCDIQTVAVLRCKRREKRAGSPSLTMPLHRNDGPSPRSAAAAPGLSIGDRISLDRAHVHISPDLGGAIVKDSFEVKTTSRAIVNIHQDRTRRS
jgi:hypothetical protein